MLRTTIIAFVVATVRAIPFSVALGAAIGVWVAICVLALVNA